MLLLLHFLPHFDTKNLHLVLFICSITRPNTIIAQTGMWIYNNFLWNKIFLIYHVSNDLSCTIHENKKLQVETCKKIWHVWLNKININALRRSLRGDTKNFSKYTLIPCQHVHINCGRSDLLHIHITCFFNWYLDCKKVRY